MSNSEVMLIVLLFSCDHLGKGALASWTRLTGRCSWAQNLEHFTCRSRLQLCYHKWANSVLFCACRAAWGYELNKLFA